jgi:hypothetical protein
MVGVAPGQIGAKGVETPSAPQSDRLIAAVGLNSKIIDSREPNS